MVRVTNSTISENHDVAVFNRNERSVSRQPTRSDTDQVSYFIADQNARILLADDLLEVVKIVFRALPTDRRRIHAQQAYLEEAVSLLAKDRVETLFVRHEAVQYYLDEFFGQISEIRTYAEDRKNAMWEMMIAQSLKKFIKNLNKATNRSITVTEYLKLTDLTESGEADSLCFTIDLTFVGNNMMRDVFDYNELEANPVDEEAKAVEMHQKRISLLTRLSPDTVAAYVETERIIAEVCPLATTPEDEYFMEQIADDYYPHIFNALAQFDGSAVDFENKEIAVLECIKQFKIIQLGLQKIIDSTVARKLTAIKSQTDFLRNKVLGENALSLSPNEADQEIEASLEEAQRIREELYKKHVTPILEQNKSDYDAALVQNREEYEASLVENRAGYEKLTTQQQAEFDKQVVSYKQENVLQKMNFDAQLVQQKADFDAQIAADKKELISGYKKELALRTEGYKKSVRALKENHSDAIAKAEEDQERVLAKYHKALAETKQLEAKLREASSLDYEVERKYRQVVDRQAQLHQEEVSELEIEMMHLSDQYEAESANQLISYKVQIDKLKNEIDQLEALAISFMGKDALPHRQEMEEQQLCVGKVSLKADDYDPLQVSPRRTKVSKTELIEEEMNEAKLAIESMRKNQNQPATIWDNGYRAMNYYGSEINLEER